MCASTTCPFVSSTRNIAFGNASATVPSISIAPSFFAKPLPHISVSSPHLGRGRVYERGLEKGNSLPQELEANSGDHPEGEPPAYDPGHQPHNEGFCA